MLALSLTLWNMSLVLDLPASPVLVFFSVYFLFPRLRDSGSTPPTIPPVFAFDVHGKQRCSPHAPFLLLLQSQASSADSQPGPDLPGCSCYQLPAFSPRLHHFLDRLTVKPLLRLLGVSQRKSTDQSKCYEV